MKNFFRKYLFFICLIIIFSGIIVSECKANDCNSSDCEIVVEISEPSISSLRNISSACDKSNMNIMNNSPYSAESGIMLVKIGNMDPDKAIENLKKMPNVLNAEKNCTYKAFKKPNDPKYKFQWNFKKINIDKAWKLSTGKGVKVAVIDTGVSYQNNGKFIKLEDFDRTSFADPFNFIDNTTDAFDDNGHGSHVAGTIAQSTNNSKGVAGIAFKAVIMPIKVLDSNGSGSLADIAEGVKYAAAHGAKVINLSLGGPTGSRILENACKYARSKGCVIVCAAGNDGSDNPNYPAAYKSCISVSAIRYDNQLAPYSSRGKSIDIAAPGGDMSVDQNHDGYPDGIMQNTIKHNDPSKQEYALYQGTSMASPHVAGVAALIVSTGVKNPDIVEKILKETAFKKNLKLEDGYGAGILDAGAALSKARNMSVSSSPLKNGDVTPKPIFAFIISLLLIMIVRRFAIKTSHIEKYISSFWFVLGTCSGVLGLSFVPFPLLPKTLNFAFSCSIIPIILILLSIPFKNMRRFAGGIAIGISSALLASLFDKGGYISTFSSYSGFNNTWVISNAIIDFIVATCFIRFSPEEDRL